jgi:hypothetical protein
MRNLKKFFFFFFKLALFGRGTAVKNGLLNQNATRAEPRRAITPGHAQLQYSTPVRLQI